MIDQARDLALRTLRFAARHVWSLSLSSLSALSFARLASELRENELGPFDAAVASRLQAGRGSWDAAMLLLTRFGEFRSLALLCGVATLALAFAGRRREAVYVLACTAGAGLGCSVLKLIFHRLRPDLPGPYLLSLPDSYSFPSGHSMGSIGLLGSLAMLAFAWPLARAWRLLSLGGALLLVFGVAASRVYFGVHYPSDVVGGLLAGAAWVAALTGWFYPRLLPAEATVRGPEPS